MAHRNVGAHQCRLEGERTAQDEGHEVAAPERAKVRDRIDGHAIPEDAVARHVMADVEIGAERWHFRVAGFRNGKDRSRFGIADAKAQEVVGIGGRKNDDVPLLKSFGETARRCVETALAARLPQLGSRVEARGVHMDRVSHLASPLPLPAPHLMARRDLCQLRRENDDESNFKFSSASINFVHRHGRGRTASQSRWCNFFHVDLFIDFDPKR